MRQLLLLAISCILSGTAMWAQTTGTWNSTATGTGITYKVTESPTPAKDASGKYLTVVYLENLALKKLGNNPLTEDVNWLLSQGYRVVELDYANHGNAKAIYLNTDIISINDALFAGNFCGLTNCSNYRSYVLFEGYRIARDIPYFKDNPLTYNYPSAYTVGDTLRMDLIYPANASEKTPVVLSFSYSNSSYGSANVNQRLNLGNTLAGFDDSVLEGAPAHGIAWAIADHPKYCPWGNGKPTGGANDTYKSYQVNPDAAQKVKSAIRTLRQLGSSFGLSGKTGIYGFSRGSDAGSMAIGDRSVPEFETAGFHQGVDDAVQAAALGPGMFDFTKIYKTTGDGDGNLETRCPWAWGALETNSGIWEKQGSAYLAHTSATAPVLFFYNTDDANYYKEQIGYFKSKLDSLGVATSTLIDHGQGHSVPKTTHALTSVYSFFTGYLTPPSVSTQLTTGLSPAGSQFAFRILSMSDNQLNFSIELENPGNLTIRLFDLSGKNIYNTTEFVAIQGTVVKQLTNLHTSQISLIQISSGKNSESQKLTYPHF